MLAEAADRAGAESVATLTRVAAAAPPQEALPAMIRAYLSKEHVDGVETGCPVAALGSETPRQAPKVRRAATRRIKEMIDVVARHSPDQGAPGAYKRALVTVATMVGALVLARAVDDPKLSKALREASLKHLDPTAPRNVCTDDRGAGGRGGGRFTREGATKAELGGAELARAGTRRRGVFRSALACRRP